MHSEKLVRQSPAGVVMEVRVPAESDYFDGHFPQIKLLPAAAQMHIAVQLAARFFGAGLLVKKIKNLKFTNIVQPDDLVVFDLSWDKESRAVSFKATGAKSGKQMASGSFVLEGGVER